jgi:hypothetical protein
MQAQSLRKTPVMPRQAAADPQMAAKLEKEAAARQAVLRQEYERRLAEKESARKQVLQGFATGDNQQSKDPGSTSGVNRVDSSMKENDKYPVKEARKGVQKGLQNETQNEDVEYLELDSIKSKGKNVVSKEAKRDVAEKDDRKRKSAFDDLENVGK